MNSWIGSEALETYTSDWLPLLFDATIKGTVLLLAAGAAALLLRRSSAAARHLVWLLAMAGLLALPVLSDFLLPGWQVLRHWSSNSRTELLRPDSLQTGGSVANWPGRAASGASASMMSTEPSGPLSGLEGQTSNRPLNGGTGGSTGVSPSGDSAAALTVPGSAGASPSQRSVRTLRSTGSAGASPSPRAAWPTFPFSAWLLFAWAVGAVFALMPLAAGMLSLWWLGRTSQPFTDGSWAALVEQLCTQLGVKRPVSLLFSAGRPVPMTWGILRAKVLLPDAAADWPAQRRRVAILHELAHVKRRDCAAQLLAQIVCALYWFHPLVWLARRQMRTEAERACDDLVLSVGFEPPDYAQHLLQIAAGGRSNMMAAMGAIPMARSSKLEGRVRRILDGSRNRGGVPRLAAAAAVVGLAALLFPIVMLQAAQGEAFPPKELVGHWMGEAKIIVSWCRQKRLPMDLTIADDGSVRGTVGDASLRNAAIRRNRGVLGRAVNIKTDYIVTGRLDGSIVAAESIVRESVSIPLNLVSGKLAGGVHTSGSKFGGKGKMILSAAGLSLTMPVARESKNDDLARDRTVAGMPQDAAASGPTQPATGRVGERLEFNKKIPIKLTVGTPEWPEVVMVPSVEFEKRAGKIRAIVQVSKFSWPRSAWRLSIQLKDETGAVVATAEETIKTAGVIISVRFLELAQPHELSFGPVDDPGRIKWFELSLTQIDDGQGKPASRVTITEPVEAPLALDQDIPIEIEAKRSDQERVVWTESIRFDSGVAGEKKRELTATLKLKWLSVLKARWRVWLLLLDKRGKAVTRSGAQFNTTRAVAGKPFVMDEKTEVSLTIWQGGREPARFRLGLELVTDGTPQMLAEQAIPKDASRLTYVDDTAEGRRSIAASGHAVTFDRSDEAAFVEAVQIFASRYGYPKPPDEDFHVYLLDEKHQVLTDLRYPYAMIERGDQRWYTLRTPSVEVPKRFVVALAFNPHRTKGIYLGYDESVKQSNSLVGLPADGFEPVGQSYDWMVRVWLSPKPSGEKGVQRLADWKPPQRIDPFSDCIEVKLDNGRSDGKQSYGGAGPAIRFDLSDLLSKDVAPEKLELKGIRLYASRYGSGYDPERTVLTVTVISDGDKTLWQGTFPYSLFSYKAKWVDLALPQALAGFGKAQVFTVAIDPEAGRYKGIYYHYNKNPETPHSLVGTVAKGFRDLPDRQWMIRAYFTASDK